MDFCVAKSSRSIHKYFSCGLNMPHDKKLQRSRSPLIHVKKSGRMLAVKATTNDEWERPSISDEDMLVLRKRMHQLRMEEINYIPPQNWMRWEKNWYPSYHSDVCLLFVWLQGIVLNTRPGIAVGILALILFTVPASVLMLLLYQYALYSKGISIEELINLHGG